MKSGGKIEAVKVLLELSKRNDSREDYCDYMEAIASLLDKKHTNQLKQITESGPKWSGDIKSIPDKDELQEMGLIVTVCCNGHDGFYAAVPDAVAILNSLVWDLK